MIAAHVASVRTPAASPITTVTGYIRRMAVDSFTYLPRSFHAEYQTILDPPTEEVWAPLGKPVAEATIALLTSAGLYVEATQEPFDLDREREDPMWGDPTYRIIPQTARAGDLGAAHLHLNTRDLVDDPDVALPLATYTQLAADGVIGKPADHHYSFMGYQSRDLREWRDTYGPEVVAHLRAEPADAVILAPA